MRIVPLFLLFCALGISGANAIPEIIPSLEGANLSGKVLRIRATTAGHVPMVILRLADYEGVGDAVAVSLYKALRHKARFRVFHPREGFIEIAVPKEAVKGIEPGDSIKVSGYMLSGQDGDRPLRVSVKGIEKVER